MNNVYIHLRITEPLTVDVVKRFKEVRSHGVKCLRTVPEQLLELVMPQIVQALRYEEFEITINRVQSGLKEFIIEKAVKSKLIFNNVYWFLRLEVDND